MELTIYEDQTGHAILPRPEKSEKIVMFFNKKIDLYMEKREEDLETYCYVLARTGSERDQGYYIRYKDIYNNNYFASFKRRAQEVLASLKFQYRLGDIRNIIFENIEKFDHKEQYKDIDIITNVSNYNILEYKDGNIGDIPIFCKNILDNTKNIKIAISPEDTKLGNINIARRVFEESLNPTDDTKNIIEEHKKRMNDHKKEELKKIARIKIREEINILKNAGCSSDEISRTGKELFPDDCSKTIKDEYNNEKKETSNVFGVGINILISIFIILLLSNLYLLYHPEEKCVLARHFPELLVPDICKEPINNTNYNCSSDKYTNCYTNNKTNQHNLKK